MKFSIYQESRIGRRHNNQDRVAHCYSREALMMVLADGMGGYLHGEVAAQIAVQYVTQAFQREARPLLAEPAEFLPRVISFAHHAILDYALDKRLDEAPRTTVVACVVQRGLAWWAHVGDSRLYLLRRGRVAQRTRDHSQVQALLDQGKIRPEEVAQHPARNRIYSCLGSNSAPKIESSPATPLRDSDVLALATDGAWGPFTDLRVAQLLGTEDVMHGVPQMLAAAEAEGGPNCDNLTLIAMRWHDESLPPGSADSSAQTAGESTATISTQMMTDQDIATRLDPLAKGAGGKEPFSELEIERAIAELNAAIQKFSKPEKS